jgi:hypothetical protein
MRFTNDGSSPSALFYSDADGVLVGAVALYGNMNVNTVLVLASYRKGIGEWVGNSRPG